MSFAGILESLIAGETLTSEKAENVMNQLMDGELHDAQIGAVLVLIRQRGATPAELAGFAKAMREHAVAVKYDGKDLIDTCGTGGGSPSFNLSTAAALMAAGAGAKVAKHGNRKVTGSCGSADVLEALGVKLGGDEAHMKRALDEAGVTFLFAPAHHPAMKHAGPVRQALGVRTVFNQLGPLANPAGAQKQLIGVFDAGLLRPMAEALRELGSQRAFVVHGRDGLDEVSPRDVTDYAYLEGDHIRAGSFSPKDFGIDPVKDKALQAGEDAEENGKILMEAICDADSPRFEAALPNAAVALMLAELAGEPAEAAEKVREAVKKGEPKRTLQKLAEVTQSP
ncbi:MAG: anthranilate phosphoribosyltransferase [Fimbriimonadaceae bacterium]